MFDFFYSCYSLFFFAWVLYQLEFLTEIEPTNLYIDSQTDSFIEAHTSSVLLKHEFKEPI